MNGISLGTAIALIRELSLRNVPDDLVFASATARDTFFASNASRLSNGLTIVINSTTTPELQIYRGQAGEPYDNTEWEDITGIIRGPRGLKGDAGELSGDNLLYVSASANPPITNPDGSRTAPFPTIQQAINALTASDEGVEVVDGSTYTEDLTINRSIRLFAPSAEIVGNITISDGEIVNIYIQNITGTVDEDKLVGFYRNGSRSVISSGTQELDLIADRVDISQELEVEQTIIIGTENTENSWRIQQNNELLDFARYETNAYVTRGSFGSSLTTDVLYLDSEQSTINFRDEDNTNIRDRNIARHASATEFVEFGDSRVANGGTLIGGLRGIANVVTMVSDISNPDGSLKNFNIQLTRDTTSAINQIQYTYTAPSAPEGVDAFLIRSLEIDFGTTKTVRTRLEVFDVTNNRLLYETLPASQIAVAPQFTGTGVTELRLFRLLYFVPGNEYRITQQFDQNYELGGTNAVTFQPYFRLRYWDSINYYLRQRSLIRSQTSDLTISNSNYLLYRDNTILFTQDSASTVTLTIPDGVFEDSHELTVAFYPSTSTNEGLVNVQMGTNGTINGESSLMMLRDSVITIHHTTNNAWILTSSDQHPITVRRDTPTIPQMQALTRASINGNSAFWFVANDQILANEQSIDNTIFVEALRDDLLDLNGNPIPTTATQKNTSPILFEAGTMCRIFSSTPTQSIIRVVFTPERSSSTSRIDTENTDLTISSTNIAEYRGDTILYTHTSGIRTITIQDDVFDINDEITIKHFASGSDSTVRVNITQQGTGGNIDGMSTLQLQRGQSARLKYIGGNQWRIISMIGAMSGTTPSTTTPEVHAFRIDIPSRVDVNANPDTVNTSHTVNYSITNHSLITSAVLHIGTSTFNLTTPTQDGVNTESITISGISLSSIQNYNMFIELNGDSGLRSNTQVLRVINLPQMETMYFGSSSDIDYATINIATLTTREVLSGSVEQFTFTLPIDDYAVMLIPNNLQITSLKDLTLDTSIPVSTFDKVDDARIIDSVTYDGYSHRNESGISGIFDVEVSLGGV